MMVGTYTGGSVNLVAMADAFDAGGELVSTSVVADNLLMALYFFALIAIPTASFFRKHFRHPLQDEIDKRTANGEVRITHKAIGQRNRSLSKILHLPLHSLL